MSNIAKLYGFKANKDLTVDIRNEHDSKYMDFLDEKWTGKMKESIARKGIGNGL